MAFCPDRGKEASPQAASCPNCGHPSANATRVSDRQMSYGDVISLTNGEITPLFIFAKDG